MTEPVNDRYNWDFHQLCKELDTRHVVKAIGTTFKIRRYEPLQETNLYKARRNNKQRKSLNEMDNTEQDTPWGSRTGRRSAK
jgi:hypothetical protein